MKLFTGWVVSAGLVFTAAAANAQVLAPYGIGQVALRCGVRHRGSLCGDAAGCPGAALRAHLAAAGGGLHGGARQRVFAARNSAAARPRLHDFGDRSRRRRRAAGDRCPHRADHPLHAGIPDGRNFNEDLTVTYGLAAPPPMSAVRGAPRPPGSIPHVASRTGAGAESEPACRKTRARSRQSNRRRCSRSRPMRNRSRRPRLPPSARPGPPRRRSSRRRKCQRYRGWSELHCESAGSSQ